MNKSVWTAETSLPKFPHLQGEIKTDVLVIGGGICGILCALSLKQAGIEYVLVEGNTIASGITKNTTAKITSQHGLICHKLLKDYGKEKAGMYIRANEDALKDYEKICRNIDCDFEIKDSCVYSLKSRDLIEKEVKAAIKLGLKTEYVQKTELPFDVKGAVKIPHQAQFNPLKFIREISKDLNIYENTFIRNITGNTAISENGRIKANKIIIATHFPFINKHGSYFLKLYQHRSYVAAFENAASISCMYVDEDLKGMSLRNYGNLLLVGGGSHRTGKDGGAWKEIINKASKYYPDSRLRYTWATQDCMSLDSIPYIGRYSRHTPDMYVATGFNKWGFTTSMAAAKILCDAIQGKENDCAEVFSPHRSMLKSQLFVNGFESAVNLVTPSAKRCPHLGCALKWNKYEHTWDCPCHGSRFERGGKLIDNPATKNS